MHLLIHIWRRRCRNSTTFLMDSQCLVPSFSNLFSGTDRPNDPLNPYLNMKVPTNSEWQPLEHLVLSILAARRRPARLWWRWGNKVPRIVELALDLQLGQSSSTARPCELNTFFTTIMEKDSAREKPKPEMKKRRKRKVLSWCLCRKLSLLPLGCAT